ncbi:aldehyde dehydrogenase family protein [Planomonospora parontospora]|uniref:aldehyde dehydrogenase family protein n=1 Tax=Planomonospora parontospora TaxID=58119 RepID=UPI00166F97AA|nr:aldehyde dehydrogenase family protein [Planomonospora parontospora]GGL36131.1 aldehyde dehydrogenase [Planomonospora parontospora subsp. antibiotica]GII17407.1 aldehyde dehydrogenase [Planomonospora parontospora subsp. antibiotica]
MSTATGQRTFDSLDPATGTVVGTHPVHDAAAVRAAVAEAGRAAQWWGGLSRAERRRRLLDYKAVVTRDLARIAETVHRETGKPKADAVLEVILTVIHLDWAARNARRVLGPRRVFPGLVGANLAATLEYQPLGVVGVIGPWNYPVFTPMGSIAYALAAGNAVVFKPSELTPGTGVLLAELFAESVPEQPVFRTVTGLGETGAALAGDPGVQKIAFTGSTATAKRVMAACAANLTPLVAECGGKDALIVDADADVRAAADAALWGAMSNAGQTCAGVERVYVVDAVYDAFMRELTGRAAAIRAGEDYGPITMPAQLDVIRRHIDDAVARGRAVVGGPESVRAPYVDPVIVEDVPEDSPAVREETFGPTVTVKRVADAEEALERANATAYGLAGTVFSGDARRAVELARRMRSGMTAINSVISFASVPALPFGGLGDSGFGRIHGADGLREFARPKAIARQRFALPGMNLTSFDRGQKELDQLVKVVTFLHGRRKR